MEFPQKVLPISIKYPIFIIHSTFRNINNFKVLDPVKRNRKKDGRIDLGLVFLE